MNPKIGENLQTTELQTLVNATELRVTRFIEGGPKTLGVFDEYSMDDGIYISHDVALDPETTELPHVSNLKLLPGARLGAADSQHEVLFGEAEVEVNGVLELFKVAIKSFDTDSKEALREHNALLEARKRGLYSFDPLAFAIDGDKTYLITELRPELETLDNLAWDISPLDTESYLVYIAPALKLIAEITAFMHSKGIIHGDLQPKNIARDDVGDTVILDLEYTNFADTPEQLADMIAGRGDFVESLTKNDILTFWYALTHPMPDRPNANLFLEDESFATCMRVFEEDFLSPYLSYLYKYLDSAVVLNVDIDELKQRIMESVARIT